LRQLSQQQSNQHYSKLAEDLVAQFALSKGWKILRRNFRRPGSEIDIIMMKEKTMVAVEVKFRMQVEELSSLVSKNKGKAIVRGIKNFLTLNEYEPDLIRIDLAVVSLTKGRMKLVHYITDVVTE